ncbi:hypothetical protein AAULR_24516, partial [Lacticaseibacillus rhamnosus MTCC 5462]
LPAMYKPKAANNSSGLSPDAEIIRRFLNAY